MRKSTKKGFTIVELVIVIAVIAILAAVLIPTFTGIIRKARESTDIQLIRNLNTAVATAKALDGKNATMHEAVADAFDAGYDLDKIKASAKNNRIVWDSVNDVFCYYDADEDDIKYLPEQEIGEDIPDDQYWIISDATSNKYSTYLNNGFTVPTDGVVTTTVGLDVGNVKGIKEIRYENLGDGKNVIFRTYGGTLYINAPKDTVSHYGASEVIDITAVDTASFHEFGSVGYTKIAAGRYVAEATAEINTLVATAVQGVALETKTAAITQVVTPIVAEGAPKLQLVVADGAAADVAAKLEEVAVVEIDTSNSEELANIQAGATLFVCGSGTKDNPYLIATKEHMQNIGKKADTYSYYQVIAEEIDCSNWTSVSLNGNFDGNGVVLNNLSDALFEVVDGDSVLLENFTINANISVSGGVGAVVNDSDTLNLTIDSVDVHGVIIGASWVTPYVEFGPGPTKAWNLTIKNSISDAKLVATSGMASGFVGHPYNDVSNGSLQGLSVITIIDSAYIGNMSVTGDVASAGNYNFKYFTINGNDNRITTKYSAAFIDELGFNPEGTLYAVPTNDATYPVINNADGSKTFFGGNYGKNLVDRYKKDNVLSLSTAAQTALPANVGDAFTITKVSGASKAVVSLQIAPNEADNEGSYLGTYMTEEIDVSSVAVGGTFASNEVKYFEININSGVTSETGLSGNIFNVVNSFYGKNAHNGATVRIVQFDANGNVLNVTSIQIAAPHLHEAE